MSDEHPGVPAVGKLPPGEPPRVTPREKEILGLIAEGLTDQGIAERLCVSINTVHTHVAHLREKFQVPNRVALMREAHRTATVDANGTSAMTVRRVWADAEFHLLAAVSPDGRYLCYAERGTGDLALRELATGKQRRLTCRDSRPESQGSAYFPRISRDGRQIAYIWHHQDLADLRLIGLDGSSPRLLYRTEAVRDFNAYAWSPDAKQILASFVTADKTWQIVWISVADGSVRVLKSLPYRNPHWMSLSPDGRTIAYDYPPDEKAPERDIFLLAGDGSREIPLIQHPANDWVLGWSPDGNRLLFASDRARGDGAWMIEVADGKPHGAPELVRSDMGWIAPIGFTRAGAFYYTVPSGIDGVLQTAALDPVTGKLVAPPAQASERFVGGSSSPAWSPDGRYLAYVAQRLHSRARDRFSEAITIRSVATGEERQLSPKLNALWSVQWSPDGRSLLVTGADNYRAGIFRIDVQTGEFSPLVRSNDGSFSWTFGEVVWSADGKSIFYWTPVAGERSLRARNLETGQEKELHRKAGIGRLALSPEGRQLAFCSGGTRRLVVMLAEGGEPRVVVNVPEGEAITTVAWSADGRNLLFGKRVRHDGQKRTTELWRVRAAGGEPQKLGLAMENLRSLCIHPDGRQIAFITGEFKNDVWVMENFLPPLQSARAARP